MSQTNFDRSGTNPGASANRDAGDASLPVPPPPPPKASTPPVRPEPLAPQPPDVAPFPAHPLNPEPLNPQPLQPESPPPAPTSGASPPPRSAGPSNQGVGSARGIRWRGELEQISRQAAHESNRPTDASAGQATNSDGTSEPKALDSDRVTREAPPWLVSLIFHLILLLALALISSPAGGTIGKVMLTLGQSEQETPVELTEFSVSEIAADGDAETMEEVEPEPISVFDAVELSEVDSIEPVEIGTGPKIAADQPMFEGRTGAMKEALMAIYGGTTQTQEAVELGLEWLRRQQTKDGSWSMKGSYSDGATSENKAAATAMALLAFMGDGHTHQDGKYATVVDRGIRYLAKLQNRDGFFPESRRREGKMYAQAQATIAICELYGMTHDSWLRPKAQLAIDFAVEAQADAGGWRYEPNVGSDTSVTGWFVMAIKSAQAAGLEVDRYCLLKVEKYLDSVQSYDGAAYAYQRFRDPSPSMTAEGLLCRQYTGWDRNHPPMGRGISALLTDSPFDINDQDVYYWYYATQVLHHFGGEPWKEWNLVMREELPKLQVKSGREIGSWAPQGDRWGDAGGRLYTTCLSLYCLEVYYRHMPLYQATDR